MSDNDLTLEGAYKAVGVAYLKENNGLRQRIAELEKVAEAAEQSIVNKHGIWVGPTVMQTLKAAGYLGGGNE